MSQLHTLCKREHMTSCDPGSNIISAIVKIMLSLKDICENIGIDVFESYLNFYLWVIYLVLSQKLLEQEVETAD